MAQHFDHDAKRKSEALAGIVLLVGAALALILANSPLQALYERTLDTRLTLGLDPLVLSKPLLLWINDGLMAVFFFLVGLEIKREVLIGELSNRRSAALPLVAALGGMIVPALIYAAINWDNPVALRGWAIPAATDIAFAIGILALLGTRAPLALKVFLLALAIIDDLGAIVIIALFYTSDLSVTALALAACGLVLLVALNRAGILRIWPYVLAGMFVWVCVLKSGVHATLAGVATAFAVPLAGANGDKRRPLETLEHALAPWVAFAIVPLFAFANAGVSLAGVSAADLTRSIPLGIALGLIIGKPLGIFGFASAAKAFGLVEWPKGVTTRQMLGVSALGGIGFTMSLFIGMLAFPDPASATDLRLGVLTGSIVSALLGVVLLLGGSTAPKEVARASATPPKKH